MTDNLYQLETEFAPVAASRIAHEPMPIFDRRTTGDESIRMKVLNRE